MSATPATVWIGGSVTGNNCLQCQVDEDVVTLYKENGKLYKLQKKEILTGVEM